MHTLIRHALPALIWLALAACAQTVAEPAPTGVPAGISATPRASATAPVTAPPTETIAPSPTVSPTASPSPTVTPTPLTEVAVAVPASWADAARSAAARAEGWRWRINISDDAPNALESGAAQLALAEGDAGIPAGQRPLALAVPFNAGWEAVSLAQAQEIVASGHSLVTALPWSDITRRQKPLLVSGRHPSDHDYPLQQSWSLLASSGFEDAAAALAPELALASEEPEAVVIAAVGDIMLDRSLGTAISNGNVPYPFALVEPVLQAADITVGNLESALGDTGEPVAKGYTFRAPPAAAQSLAGAGFDLVTLANNHALDFGPEALLQGIGLLEAAGVRSVGAGPDARTARAAQYFEVQGYTFAFLGYVQVPVEGRPPYFDTQTWTAAENAAGLAWAVPAEIAGDVAAARENADFVVVLLHSGYEYVPPPSPEQMAAAHAAVDAGATLVVGHHAHILQGVEFYQDGVIVYGLGNFAFTIDGPAETAILRTYFDAGGVRQIEFVPAIVQPGGQPRLATTEEAGAIREQIYALSRSFPNQ